jgi:hypothetical protein
VPEHYTRNTESVTAWCNHCGRPTQHAVSDGKRGRCTEHEVASKTGGYSKRQLAAQKKREREHAQPALF